MEAFQLSGTTVHTAFPGMVDEESELTSVVVRVGPYRSVELDGAQESWVGAGNAPSGARIHACAIATSVGGSREVCAPSFVWDSTPPVIGAMWVYSPMYRSFFRPLCAGAWEDCHLHGHLPGPNAIFVNSAGEIRFQLAIHDEPASANTAFGEVLWGISSSRLSSPNSNFRSIGNSRQLEQRRGLGRNWNRITVEAYDLSLRHNTRYWIHIWACDKIGNCGMTRSYPILVDLTPPTKPNRIFADGQVQETTGFMWADEIRPAWYTPGLTSGLQPVPDPESSPSYSRWRVVELHLDGSITNPGFAANGRVLPPPTTFSNDGEWMNVTQVSQGRIQGLTGQLTLGGSYLLQLQVTNLAGGLTNMWSELAIADWTLPTCVAPKLVAPGSRRTDLIKRSCAHGGCCESTEPHCTNSDYDWIGNLSAGVRMHIGSTYPGAPGGTCTDPDSGIAHLAYGIGLGHGVNNLRAPMDATVGGNTLPLRWWSSFHNLRQLASEVHYANLVCTNGVTHRVLCPEVTFKIDITPPTCNYPIPSVLGEGEFKWVQWDNRKLWVDYQNSIRDRETQLLDVNYILVEYAPEYVDGDWCENKPCRQRLSASNVTRRMSLRWLNHRGEPRPPGYQMPLELRHGFYYRVWAHATNNVGLQTEPCPTQSVLIDITKPVVGTIHVVQWYADMFRDGVRHAEWQWNPDIIMMQMKGFEDPESGIYAFYATIYDLEGTILFPESFIQLKEYSSFPMSLSHMQSFYIHFRLLNHAKLTSTYTSNVTTVDVTPPVIRYVGDFGTGSSELDFIKGPDLTWSVFFSTFDPESDVERALYCLGSFPGACDVVQQRPIEPKRGHAFHSVAGLLDGYFYWSTVFVFNYAGNQAVKVSDGFRVDASPPECGTVFDGPSFDRSHMGPAISLKVSWSGFVDRGVGIASYAVAVVPYGETPTYFLEVGLATSTSIEAPEPWQEIPNGCVGWRSRRQREALCQ